jgi:beta-galactosidase
LDKTFSFKYLPYNEFEMENAERVEDLPPSRFNYLTIHSATKGVGGDDSWGAPVHKKYRLKNRIYSQKFIIKIH